MCEPCSTRRMPLLMDGATAAVRVCAPCAKAAQVENVCLEQYFPFLEEGVTLTKQGLIKSRQVFVYLSVDRQKVFYRSADPAEGGEVKAIRARSMRSVAEPNALTVRVACTDRSHIFDADSTVERRHFAESMRMLLDFHALPKLQRQSEARAAVSSPRDEALNHRRVEAILEKNKMMGEKKMRVGRAVKANKARRETLREKYNLNTMPR